MSDKLITITQDMVGKQYLLSNDGSVTGVSFVCVEPKKHTDCRHSIQELGCISCCNKLIYEEIKRIESKKLPSEVINAKTDASVKSIPSYRTAEVDNIIYLANKVNSILEFLDERLGRG